MTNYVCILRLETAKCGMAGFDNYLKQNVKGLLLKKNVHYTMTVVNSQMNKVRRSIYIWCVKESLTMV